MSSTTPPAIPIADRYNLTITEASEYFRIGENKIREIVATNPDADFILHIGTRVLIKRKRFEDYIDRASSL